MTADKCPRCGVAVVPGYVKCPKCHAPLPMRRSRVAGDPGGTSANAPRKPFPTALVVLGIVGVGGAIALYFALRGGNSPAASETAGTAETATTAPATPNNEPTPVMPSPSPATTPHPEAAAGELERTLKHMHLWATVDVRGSTVDVRSGSCSDTAIKPVIDAAAPRLKAAGLVQLRCLEQSGTVVFTRGL